MPLEPTAAGGSAPLRRIRGPYDRSSPCFPSSEPFSMQINFSNHESYHTVPLSTFTTIAAEQQLSEDRKRLLRSIARDKSGQGAGPGVLSTASKNVYSRLVKQAVSWEVQGTERSSWTRQAGPPATEMEVSTQHRVSAVPYSSAGGSAPLRRCLTAVPFKVSYQHALTFPICFALIFAHSPLRVV